jgi:hypothetical protein
MEVIDNARSWMAKGITTPWMNATFRASCFIIMAAL